MIGTHASSERDRLSAAASLADIVARHVSNFGPLPAAGVFPSDPGALALPPGWHLAGPGDTTEHPARVAVTGHRSHGGWDGCDTLAGYAFTGRIPADLVGQNAACTLRDLSASGVTTQILATPPAVDLFAVRASGYLTAVGRRIWAELNTYAYVAGPENARSGRLIQHSLFVTSQRRTQLRSNTTYLGDTVYRAVCTLVEATVNVT